MSADAILLHPFEHDLYWPVRCKECDWFSRRFFRALHKLIKAKDPRAALNGNRRSVAAKIRVARQRLEKADRGWSEHWHAAHDDKGRPLSSKSP